MTVIPFVAESAADAVGQIRSRLGPEAIVLNVRKLPAAGLSRLWQRPRIEVLACVPEVAAAPNPGPARSVPSPSPMSSLLDIREADDALALGTDFKPAASQNSLPQYAGISLANRFGGYPAGVRSAPQNPRSDQLCDAPQVPVVVTPLPHAQSTNRFSMPELRAGQWRSADLLRTMGISPLNTERVLEHLKHLHGEHPPAALRAELAFTRAALAHFWKRNKSSATGLHIFIGAPGCGKTTAICKWLTQAVLLDGATARVWRLDVPRANTAEALSVHCEILNVPVERSWKPGVTWTEDHLFVDLPGIEAGDDAGMAELKKLLCTMPGASVSLVMNAAYDTPLLQSQVRAFAGLPLTDLIFTHLDEEPRWSKLWNFVLGTNYTLSFLSAGQNIPGQFLRATPEALFPDEMRESP